MKATVYMRVAVGSRGTKFSATVKPNYAPLTSGSGWYAHNLPTAAFALVLDIPDEAFERASQVLAEIQIPNETIQVAAEVG